MSERGNTTTEPTNGVNMLGMDRNTGKPLSGTDHICQSIVDILTTPLGTRVMLPEYGSKLFDLVDNPTDPSLAMRIIMESAGAIARWEPRCCEYDRFTCEMPILCVCVAVYFFGDKRLYKQAYIA